jgi:HSP20 family protein
MLARLNDNWGILNYPWKALNEIQRDFFGMLNGVNEGLYRLTTGFPKMTLEDNEKEIVVKVFLPGYSADDIDVEVVSDFLTIRASRERPELAEGEEFLHRERSFGSFEETIKLPALVKSAKVTAASKDGVLTVSLPKQTIQGPRTIKVK